MSEPIVFVSRLKIKDSKLEAFKQASREIFEMMEASKPGTLVHLGFVNEDGTNISFIHVYPIAEAMDDHIGGVEDRATKALEFLDTIGYEIYGAPSGQVMQMMEQFAGSGITLSKVTGFAVLNQIE
ncbi:MAG: hypothetical protein IIA51_08550 [Chloroflexi bacterium]|nr:hypothetical protein [Chloroflexota bacterium]MCH8341585.1 hypothetical protein [Chloroflexota bacterium]